MVSENLRQLAAMSLFTHVHGKVELEAISSGTYWQVDLQGGTISFSAAGEERAYPVQLLGSIARSAGTWMWGWEASNAEHFPEEALRAARRVQESGGALGIRELIEPVVVLSNTPSLMLQLAAETLGAVSHTMLVDAGQGLSLVLAVNIGPMRPLDSAELLAAVMRGTELGVTHDHRSALERYATRLGLRLERLDAGSRRMLLRGATGGVEFESDESGRLVALHEAAAAERLQTQLR
ncbi:DUF6882 domain-containing protein [Gulosibacter sp. 10]|uniref:DUF6882 domain-containing protein n=1 Tax=Gulosibacter sp. 10 TaxID=1255570 RepID=UPI00097E84CF|nr:DUF6882 domain-containing protein [Gulosibacter sp. 10]SJM51999.1 hypothetical protein FM112_02340 [Gulosibacter sp. 10]